MTLLSFLLKAILVAFGYGVAVVVAVTVTLAGMTAPSVFPDDGAWGSLFAYMDGWQNAFPFGLMLTFPSALPGFLFAVFLAARFEWRHWKPYVQAGGANSYAALLFATAYAGGSMASSPVMIICCLAGGLAGGYAYWLVAGRFINREDYSDVA